MSAALAQICVVAAKMARRGSMFPFVVNKNWFESYWYNDEPRPKRQTSGMRLARYAVCIALLAGSAVAVSHLGSSERPGHAHGRTGMLIE
jgi:hypothetical protein